MSAGGVAVFFPPREKAQPRQEHPLWRLAERFTPSQGWPTLVLLWATLAIVAWTLTDPGWVATPGMTLIVLLAPLVGLALAKVRAPWPLLHLAGLAVGFLLVVWQTTSLAEDGPLGSRLQEVWHRMAQWYDAAVSGGISTDLLPFSLGLLAGFWLLAYFSAWAIFRRSNVWVAVVLAGTVMLTNLSFLPDQYASRFFLFVFFAMLLVVRVNMVQRHEAWRRSGVRFDPINNWLTMHATVWVSVLVLLIASFLPMRVYVSRTLADVWKFGRSPIERLEDDFARLFSGVPSRKNVTGRFFGRTLPFMGKISFGGEVVFWANSRYPSYWLSQTYSEYTSQGWRVGRTEPLEVRPEALPPASQDSLKRVPVEQTIQLTFASQDFLAGGNLDSVSRDIVVETLAPKEFVINIQDPSGDAALPEDLRAVAQELRQELRTPPRDFLESYISRILPKDLVLIGVSRAPDAQGVQAPRSVTLARKEPITPDVVSWEFTDRLEANETYTMVSYVSVATEEELRVAGTEYNSFIRDHYLQVPATLPQRVRDLAQEITRNAPTPYDKAIAIERFLRDPKNFTYSQDIEAPPQGVDGVDWFLFETKTGYSDYFGSAMAVMLRTVGVPARMAAGYAPGELEPQSGQRVVRDSDSHGWVQVYFPGYGWIDFEPTPAWPVHQRVLAESPTPDLSFGRETEEGYEEYPYDLFDPSIEGQFPDLSNLPVPQQESWWDPRAFAVPLAVVLGAIGILWAMVQLLWTRSLVAATPSERAYTKLSRLGALAGIRRRAHQTPIEYAMAVGSVIPAVSSAAQRIALAFAANRYGQRNESEQDERELDQAWKSIRGKLLARAFARLKRLGKGQGG